MTLRMIHVPVPSSARSTALSGPHAAIDEDAADGPAGACEHFGHCNRDACGDAQRVALRCPSTDAASGPA